jgi:tetratricopeptide (TPR) repeat protein
MAGSSRGVVYDRAHLLKAASRAHERQQKRKAIALYRQVLSMEPDNTALHARVAPLLARTRQRFDALLSFQEAANGMLREGRTAEAIGIYREAATLLPHETDLWASLARLMRQHRNPAESIETLLEGRRHFRRRRRRPEAIWLLRQVRLIEPWHRETVLDLCRLLWRTRQRDEALALVAGLRANTRGTALRRVCWLQFRLSPTPRNLWRWLRVALRREASPAKPGASARSRA